MLSTYQSDYQASRSASLLLWLAVLQGSTFTLTIAMHAEPSALPLSKLVSLLWFLNYGFAALALFVSFGINWLTWLVRYRLPLTLLLIGAVASCLWSIDPGLTLERSVHLLGSTLIALYIGFSLPLSNILRICAWALGTLMLLSAIAALALPDLGIENYAGKRVWKGVLPSKNTLGFWSAISVMLFASLASWQKNIRRKMCLIAMIALSLLCLTLSVSATSFLALLIACMVMLYLHATLGLRLPLLATTLLGLLFLALSGFAIQYIDTAELIGRSGDLTGRSQVWSQTWELILQRPLSGYGYGTIWYPTSESLWIQQSLMELTWTVFHAHNGLLQLASEIGLPLTLLAVLMIILQLVELMHCQYQRQQPGVLFIIGFTVALLVSNYSEARILMHRELFWILFLAMPISMLQQVSISQPKNPGQLTPIPLSLPSRTLSKLESNAPLRVRRRQLKARLRRKPLPPPPGNSS